MKDNIQVIQREPNSLNNIATIMTGAQWAEIPGDPRNWVPTIIPDVSKERQSLAEKGVTVERVNLSALNPEQQNVVLLETANLYGRIFAGAPWFETPSPVEEQADALREDLSRPDAQFLLVRNGKGEIKGFSMSWTTTPKELVAEKWETEDMQEKILDTLTQLGISPDNPITYFAEAGIDPELRGLNISNIFYANRLEVAKELGYPVIVRTKDSTNINFNADAFGMTQIFGPVIGFGNRRNGKRSLKVRSNTFYGGVDTEKPDRVLWLLGGGIA